MRLLILVAAVVTVLGSCNRHRESESPYSTALTFFLDTVYVDPGDEILFLRDNLFVSDLSPDKRYLINFNRSELVAERINLDELKLEKKIQFEKEGPERMPVYFSGFRINSEEQFLVWSSQSYGIYDQRAKKIKELELEKIAAALLGAGETIPMGLFEDADRPGRLLAVIMQWKEEDYFLLDVDLTNRSFQKIALPDLARLKDYSMEILYEGQFMGSFGVGVFPIAAGDKIILANNSINESLVFDKKTGGTRIVRWNTPLLGGRRDYLPPAQVEETSGAKEEIVKRSREGIFYGRLIWDDAQKRFFRFSVKEQFRQEKNENGQYTPTGAEVYLSIFDKNLDLLAESLVPDLKTPPKKHFVKDGKIWIFENIADEMAFIRLTVE